MTQSNVLSRHAPRCEEENNETKSGPPVSGGEILFCDHVDTKQYHERLDPTFGHSHLGQLPSVELWGNASGPIS